MSFEFPLPDVGEGLTEADIVAWKVAPGDTVTVNQILVEIETAKSLVELPSPQAGTVGALLVEESGPSRSAPPSSASVTPIPAPRRAPPPEEPMSPHPVPERPRLPPRRLPPRLRTPTLAPPSSATAPKRHHRSAVPARADLFPHRHRPLSRHPLRQARRPHPLRQLRRPTRSRQLRRRQHRRSRHPRLRANPWRSRPCGSSRRTSASTSHRLCPPDPTGT